MGIRIVSDDEAKLLPDDVHRVELKDLDLPAIRAALAAFDVSPEFDGLALACLDHGAAPPGVLRPPLPLRAPPARRRRGKNDLTAFAFLPEELPDYLTRARAMMDTARAQDPDTPSVFLDTGPAAAIGALQDPHVAAAETQLVLNLGNMHALAFHLRGTQHHQPLRASHRRDLARADRRLHRAPDRRHARARGSLQQQRATASSTQTAKPHQRRAATTPLVAVTGPQRSKIRNSRLDPYFATPHGDMMISGCFGLLRAFAAKYPEHAEEIDWRCRLAAAKEM